MVSTKIAARTDPAVINVLILNLRGILTPGSSGFFSFSFFGFFTLGFFSFFSFGCFFFFSFLGFSSSPSTSLRICLFSSLSLVSCSSGTAPRSSSGSSIKAAKIRLKILSFFSFLPFLFFADSSSPAPSGSELPPPPEKPPFF
ncbi:MAG: hypothetical protein BWY61_00545 [Firmicutes bacterium ADurb.Bin354]|nr:MAG: hypothetical protein BWY61_00545 [Firmicutes bacterium ADurb.Bin354]